MYIKHLFLMFIVIVNFTHEVFCANEYTISTNDSAPNLLKRIENLEKYEKRLVDKSGFRKSFPSNIFENFLKNQYSSKNKCQESLMMFFNDLINLKPWALEMLDATGKPPSSVMLSTTADFGSSEDCLQLRIPSSDSNGSPFVKGKYCMVHMQHPFFQPSIYRTSDGRDYVDAFGQPPQWVKNFVHKEVSSRFGLYLGACIPSTCTKEDLSDIIYTYADPIALNVTITDCAVEKEADEQPKRWPRSTKVAIFILAIILTLCGVGTFLDLIHLKKLKNNNQIGENMNGELLRSFSIISNSKLLFTVDSRKSPINFIHGMRAVFCLLILFAHYIVFPTLWKETRHKNIFYMQEIFKPEIIFVFLNNGLILVEGFFFISSFLLTYLLWRTLEKTDGKVDITDQILMKYWRLSPVHFFVIIFSFVMPFMSLGFPVWENSWEYENAKCFTNGWKNVLYLQNLDHFSDICWIHTWYIAVTMQYVVLFVPLIVVTYKYPKCGILVSFMLLFGSMVRDYNTSIEQGFLFSSFNSLVIPQRVFDYLATMYLNTISHISTNLVGMLSGWIVLKFQKTTLSKGSLTIGWVLCALCYIVSFYFPYLPIEDRRIGALYNTTRGTLYCLGLSWIMFVCSTGCGGFIDTVLSWKALIPVSKMSYCIYLVHPLFLVFRDASLTDRIYLDKISIVMEIIPFFLISFAFSFVVYVAVEVPANRVYDLLKKKKLSSK